MQLTSGGQCRESEDLVRALRKAGEPQKVLTFRTGYLCGYSLGDITACGSAQDLVSRAADAFHSTFRLASFQK